MTSLSMTSAIGVFRTDGLHAMLANWHEILLELLASLLSYMSLNAHFNEHLPVTIERTVGLQFGLRRRTLHYYNIYITYIC